MAKKTSKKKVASKTAKKKAATKTPATKKTAKKKAATKKAPSKKTPVKKAPDKSFAVIYHLRGSSKHWPKKIGDFIFSKLHKKWILFGREIGIGEWNLIADEAIARSTSDHDTLLTPSVKIVEVEVKSKKEDSPAWEKNLKKANESRGTKKEEDKKTNECSDPPKQPTKESLY